MFQSGADLAAGATLRTAVCVVGTGPAGLTVASELARSGTDVVLVETGGRGLVPDAQPLSDVTFTDLALVDIRNNRRRQVGGNSNAWVVKMADLVMGVRYAPLDPIDFTPPPHRDGPGWPFTAEELRPWYERAQVTAQAGPFDYSPGFWSEATTGPWDLDPAVVESKAFRFGPKAAFHDTLAQEVGASPRATVLHDATAVELLAERSDGPITAVRCRTLAGNDITVEADRFVVAAGGLGTPHLLLASTGARPAGIGNAHDLVGRYLQDHPLIAGGHLVFGDRQQWNRSTFYDMRAVGGHSGLGYLALSPTAIERHGLGGLSAVLFPRPSVRRSRTMEMLREYYDAARQRSLGVDHLRRLPQLAAGLDYAAIAVYRKARWQQTTWVGFGRGGWSAMPDLPARFARWEVVHQAEQSGEAGNRVTVGRERDAVGMPTLTVSWRWSESDARRAAAGRRLMADELARAGIGTVDLPDDGDLPGVGVVGGTAHHMGTTRMHPDPRHGVVDADGRVHGVPNLYLTGSSVFPTSGYANPTLTVIALAHRLADHLSRPASVVSPGRSS